MEDKKNNTGDWNTGDWNTGTVTLLRPKLRYLIKKAIFVFIQICITKFITFLINIQNRYASGFQQIT